jgi:hypothetical protein
MIAAVCSAPCALQHRTESGLQARPLILLELFLLAAYLGQNLAGVFLLDFGSDQVSRNGVIV